MPFDYSGGDNFFPKVGAEKVIFTIKNIERVDETEYCFATKKDGKLGYYYRVSTEEGINYNLNSFGLYNEFKNKNIQEGATVSVDHVATGKWDVEVLSRKG